MIIEIIKDHKMLNAVQTNWIDTRLTNTVEGTVYLQSLQAYWSGAAPVLNGTIDIQFTNTPEMSSNYQSIAVNSISNINNTFMAELCSSYRYIRLNYTANGILSGTLNAVLYYTNLNN